MLEHVKPVGGREVMCDIVAGTADYQKYFKPMALHLPGLTITAKEPDVNHAFRFVRRRDVLTYNESKDWVIDKGWWENSSAHGDDSILLMKQFISERRLSQNAMIVNPWQVAKDDIAPQKLMSAPRAALGPREITEFKKTAKKL